MVLEKIIWGQCPLTPSTEGGRIEWGGIWEGCPLLSQLWGLGERCDLTQWRLGQSPFQKCHKTLHFAPICQCFEFVNVSCHIGGKAEVWGNCPCPTQNRAYILSMMLYGGTVDNVYFAPLFAVATVSLIGLATYKLSSVSHHTIPVREPCTRQRVVCNVVIC